jgi:hypothetical protein
MSELESSPSAIQPANLKSWLPVDAIIDQGRPAIEWMEMSDVEFSEPFFTETVARVKANGARRILLTDFDLLLRLENCLDSLDPTGFIFHSSRCGSTLLANACRALQGSLVIAEAPVLDKIVSRFFTDAETPAKELLYMVFLKGAVHALGQRRKGDERHFFIKFACTSTLQMSRIRRIWPNVPFVFLYRDPVEVIVSNLRSKPQWLCFESNQATAAAILGVEKSQLNDFDQAESCARALGRFFTEADRNRSSHTLPINYAQLTFETLISAVKSFGVVPSPEELDAIRLVSRLYSKDLTQTREFEVDSESKRASASAHVIAMARKWSMPPYERLNT